MNIEGKNFSKGTRIIKALEKAKEEKPLDKSGTEKLVYENPNNSNELIKEYRNKFEYDKHRKKKIFYLSKLLHLVFPKNFPDMKLILPNSGVEVVEKINAQGEIEGDEDAENKLFILLKQVKELDINLDWNTKNYLKDKNGDIKYIDSPDFYNDTSKFRSYIENNLKGEKLVEALDLLESVEKEHILYMEATKKTLKLTNLFRYSDNRKKAKFY